MNEHRVTNGCFPVSSIIMRNMTWKQSMAYLKFTRVGVTQKRSYRYCARAAGWTTRSKF